MIFIKIAGINEFIQHLLEINIVGSNLHISFKYFLLCELIR